MIAFPDSLPLIVLGNRRAIAFDREWLARMLALAAHRAGHADWWFGPHVAQGVYAWMRSLSDCTTLAAESFTRAVREALKAIGCADVGACFEEASLFARISLVEIAQQAGNGFELAFFASLDSRLREVLGAGGSYCELHSLEPCVKILRKGRNWNRRSEELRAEIVTFARSHTARALGGTGASGGRDLFLHVA